jgi:hypothetical protein
MWFLLRSRFKTLIFTLVLGLAAPRIARVLRGYGQRQQRSGGGGALKTTVPLTAADALDKVAGWARPQKEKRRRFGRG